MALEPIFNVPKDCVKEVDGDKIYIRKPVTNPDNPSNTQEYTFFEGILHYAIPDEKRYRWLYLFKCRSGRVFLKSLEFGPTMAVSVNDSEFVTRSKFVRCKENTIIFANAFIYEIDPLTQELRLDVTLRS